MLFDVGGRFLVGFGGVSADVAGVLVAAVGWFLEDFTAVLSPPY